MKSLVLYKISLYKHSNRSSAYKTQQ